MYPVYNKFYYKPLPECIEVKKSPIEGFGLFAIEDIKQNFDLGTTQSCVTPVFLKGDIHEAFVMVKELREKYFIFCSIVVYPVIPKGFILLRLIPTSSHNIEDVNETLSAFSKIRSKLEDGTYRRIAEKANVS